MPDSIAVLAVVKSPLSFSALASIEIGLLPFPVYAVIALVSGLAAGADACRTGRL